MNHLLNHPGDGWCLDRKDLFRRVATELGGAGILRMVLDFKGYRLGYCIRHSHGPLFDPSTTFVARACHSPPSRTRPLRRSELAPFPGLGEATASAVLEAEAVAVASWTVEREVRRTRGEAVRITVWV